MAGGKGGWWCCCQNCYQRTDEFNREEIGPNWTVLDGDWSIENGKLTTSDKDAKIECMFEPPEMDNDNPDSVGILFARCLLSEEDPVTGLTSVRLNANYQIIVFEGDEKFTLEGYVEGISEDSHPMVRLTLYRDDEIIGEPEHVVISDSYMDLKMCVGAFLLTAGLVTYQKMWVCRVGDNSFSGQHFILANGSNYEIQFEKVFYSDHFDHDPRCPDCPDSCCCPCIEDTSRREEQELTATITLKAPEDYDYLVYAATCIISNGEQTDGTFMTTYESDDFYHVVDSDNNDIIDYYYSFRVNDPLKCHPIVFECEKKYSSTDAELEIYFWNVPKNKWELKYTCTTGDESTISISFGGNPAVYMDNGSIKVRFHSEDINSVSIDHMYITVECEEDEEDANCEDMEGISITLECYDSTKELEGGIPFECCTWTSKYDEKFEFYCGENYFGDPYGPYRLTFFMRCEENEKGCLGYHGFLSPYLCGRDADCVLTDEEQAADNAMGYCDFSSYPAVGNQNVREDNPIGAPCECASDDEDPTSIFLTFGPYKWWRLGSVLDDQACRCCKEFYIVVTA